MGIENLQQLKTIAESFTEEKVIFLGNGEKFVVNPECYANPSLERTYTTNGSIIGFISGAILYIIKYSRSVIEFLERKRFSTRSFYLPN